jgi:3D (Asp-Asp-Asp) domain-containing protein
MTNATLFFSAVVSCFKHPTTTIIISVGLLSIIILLNLILSNNILASNNNCSTGWKVTGYFSPLESDYEGKGHSRTITIHSLNDRSDTTRVVNSEFLKDVQVEGWGQTKQGDFIGGWDGKFWGPSYAPVTDLGQPLIAGVSAATDRNLIPYESNFTIPTLPSPWNNKTLTAMDIGSGIVGKHIDIYTGVGSAAEQETYRITKMKANTVCLSQNEGAGHKDA